MGTVDLLRRLIAAGTLLLVLACGLGGTVAPTAIPVGQPADFDIQTATPTRDRAEPAQPEASPILSLADAPTRTPTPNGSPTVVPHPSRTPTAALTTTVTITNEATLPTVDKTAEPTIKSSPTVTATEEADLPREEATLEDDGPGDPAETLQGGEWDFEAPFVPWGNPYGEPCPGASVAAGWTAFTEDAEYGSSCFNENLYRPNVYSGGKSQEMTFDFINANSGIYRVIATRPGHTYTIRAYAKHDHSIAPIEMALGIDLNGGTEWSATSVEWTAWDEAAEDTWVVTDRIVTATGDSLTLFIKGFHPMADQGGKTVIDNVSVQDLGADGE